MILKLLLNIIMLIGTILINFVTGIIGNNNLAQSMVGIVQQAMQWISQALNFVYFICGDTMFIILPIAITLLVLKYTIIPLIIIFRSFIIKGNN